MTEKRVWDEGQQRKEWKDKNRNKSRGQLEGNEDRRTCISAGEEESFHSLFSFPY